MPLPAIFRTSLFRLTILYVVLFGASAAGLGGFIYLTTVGYLQRQTDEVIQTEIEVLRDEFERGQDPLRPAVALNRLRAMIDNRSAAKQDSDEWFYYMLVDRNTRKVAGNLDRWPTGEVVDGWIDFDVEAADGQLSLLGGEEEADAARAQTYMVAASAVADLADALDAELAKLGGTELLANLELPLQFVLADLEAAGIAVDTEALSALEADFAGQVKQAAQDAYAVIGKEITRRRLRRAADVIKAAPAPAAKPPGGGGKPDAGGGKPDAKPAKGTKPEGQPAAKGEQAPKAPVEQAAKVAADAAPKAGE